MIFAAIYKDEDRPALLVKTCIDATGEVERWRVFMFNKQCRDGLVVDAQQSFVLHDDLSEMDETAIKRFGPIDTEWLLNRYPHGDLDARVNNWLIGMSAYWDNALPLAGRIDSELERSWMALLIQYLVPALAEAEIKAQSFSPIP